MHFLEIGYGSQLLGVFSKNNAELFLLASIIHRFKIISVFHSKSCDIVRPLCNLLNIEYSGIENFEALMALGNLAGMNEPTRKRILKVMPIHDIKSNDQLLKY